MICIVTVLDTFYFQYYRIENKTLELTTSQELSVRVIYLSHESVTSKLYREQLWYVGTLRVQNVLDTILLLRYRTKAESPDSNREVF